MKKINLLISVLIFITISSCQQSLNKRGSTNKVLQEAVQTMEQFRKTSPFVLDQERLALWDKLETYSDNLEHTTFIKYLDGDEVEAVNMEDSIPMIYFYREAFDKVLYEVKKTKVEDDTTLIWLLYNMGFVVKTPSGCSLFLT